MRTSLNKMDSLATTALLVAALVAVLIPVCAMSVCGMSIVGMGSLADCEFMYFPSEAPSALVLEVLAFAALFVVGLVSTGNWVPARSHSPVAVRREDPPEPPGDPLSGRLII